MTRDSLHTRFVSTLSWAACLLGVLGAAVVWFLAREQALQLIAALTGLLAGVLLLFHQLARRLLTQPMHRLAMAMAAMQPGGSERLAVDAAHVQDEVGIVTASANRLLDMQQRALERERAMRAEIAEMEVRYRGVFDTTSAGLFVMSATGRLLHGNAALGRLLGHADGHLPESTHEGFAADLAAESSRLQALIDEARKTGQPQAQDLELQCQDGSRVWAHVLVSVQLDAASGVETVEGVLYDITHRKLAERLAQHRAEHDPLTGLPDRRSLAVRLAQARERVAAGGPLSAVICLDIDQFSSVNVARGTAAGDELLREAARRLLGVLRRSDLVARIGSDDFAIVLDLGTRDVEEGLAGAREVALKLQAAMARPFRLGDSALATGSSVGLSLIDGHEEVAQDSLRQAQIALQQAQAEGTGRLAVFEHVMLEGLRERLGLEDDLRKAIGTRQLELHVQPQRGVDGVLAGGEALLRWQHPQRGAVPPDQFIPLAEACGLIIPLGCWVLEEGCRILARQQQAGLAITLSVNISAAQFQHPDFVAHVRKALAAAAAPADRLILEITESVLISQVDAVARRMHELVQQGVRFSIDDFGTGFSSLAYLRRLPLYELKIDRSFIAGLDSDKASAAIVQSILSMGAHLGLHVVAEGVETAGQAAYLRQHQCSMQQGWLHGRPMPQADWLRLCRAARPGAAVAGTPLPVAAAPEVAA